MGRHLLKYLAILFIMLGGCNADYQSKSWARNHLKNKPTITVLKNFIDLGFAENRGMIFGILNGKMPKLARLAAAGVRLLILVALMLFIVICRRKPFLFILPFLFFWVGAGGNLIDPFMYGYVVDFIHIHAGNVLNWPFYFNVADASIMIGMILLLIRRGVLSKCEQKQIYSVWRDHP
jgi:signal peptidase II